MREEEGALKKFRHSGNPRRCAQPSESAGQGRLPAQGCNVSSGRSRLTFPPGGGPGRREEERQAEAAAQPGRRHGRAARPSAAEGSARASPKPPVPLCAPLCLPFP